MGAEQSLGLRGGCPSTEHWRCSDSRGRLSPTLMRRLADVDQTPIQEQRNHRT